MFSFVLKNVLFNFDSLLNRDDHATGLVSCATCVCRVDTRRNLIILITQCLLSFSCSPFHHIVSVPIKSDHDRSAEKGGHRPSGESESDFLFYFKCMQMIDGETALPVSNLHLRRKT